MNKASGHVSFSNISNQPKLAFEWLGRTKQKPASIEHHSVGDRVVMRFKNMREDYYEDFASYLKENDSINSFGEADFHIEKGGKS
jgi:hypothetical protein